MGFHHAESMMRHDDSDNAPPPSGVSVRVWAFACVVALAIAAASCGDEAEQPASVSDPVTCPTGTITTPDGMCRAPVCEPGATACGAGGRVECDARGVAWVELPCDAGAQCREGACVHTDCEPGMARCSEDGREVCSSAGTWEPAPCAGDSCAGRACACDDGVCVAVVCDPGRRRCTADAVVVCEPDGLSETVIETCDTGDVCMSETCVPATCSAGWSTCADQSVVACVGGHPRVIADCAGEGQVCSAVSGVAGCTDADCIPGTAWCDGGTAATCTPGGTIERTDCDEACNGGRCVGAPREPCEREGDMRCRAGLVERCGGVWYEVDACEADEVCGDTACLPAVCEAGTARCEGDVAVHCLDGAREHREWCGQDGGVCDSASGRCALGPCGEVASTRCDGDAVVTCDAPAEPVETCALGCVDGTCATAARGALHRCSRDAGCLSGACSNGRCVEPGQVWMPPGVYPLGRPEPIRPEAWPASMHEVDFDYGLLVDATEVTIADASAWLEGTVLDGTRYDPELTACVGDPTGEDCPWQAVLIEPDVHWPREGPCIVAVAANARSDRDGLDTCFMDAVLGAVDGTEWAQCLPADTYPDDTVEAPYWPMDESMIATDADPVACNGWRLPIEREWRVLMRSGQPWSAVAAPRHLSCASPMLEGEWTWCNHPAAPHRVAAGRPNPWGLYDMGGNLSEMILDQPQPWVPGLVSPGPVIDGGGYVVGCNTYGDLTGCSIDDRAEVVAYSPARGVRMVRTVPAAELP